MQESLKQKIHRLISAINEALAESGGVSESLDGVSEEGYDLFLILEATVVLNRKGEILALNAEDWEEEDDDLEEEEPSLVEEAGLDPLPARELTAEVSEADHEFLATLKIRFHE